MDIAVDKNYNQWLKLHSVAVALIAAFFTVGVMAPNYFGSIYSVYYKLAAIVMLSFYFYFRRFKDGTELKLLVAYCCWLVVVHIINGDFSLLDGYEQILNMWMSCVFLTAGMMLPHEKRMRMLDFVAAVYVLCFTLLGFAVLYSVISGVEMLSPFTGETLCYIQGGRLYVFDKNTNIVGNWFFLGISFSVYLFLRSKNLAVRIISVATALISYFALALTFSRSSMIGFSLGAGMFVVLLAYKYLPIKKKLSKALVLVLIMLVVVPLAYSSFQPSVDAVNKLRSVKESGEVAAQVQPAAYQGVEYSAQPLVVHKSDAKVVEMAAETEFDRNVTVFQDTGRLSIYRCGVQALIDNPLRLITGSLDPAAQTNQILADLNLKNGYAHHHNSYLDVLMTTGLMGFLAAMAFIVLLVIKMVKLYFCENPKADLAVKWLTIVLTGILLYNMLETVLFYSNDIRSISFFIIAGIVIAGEREFCHR